MSTEKNLSKKINLLRSIDISFSKGFFLGIGLSVLACIGYGACDTAYRKSTKV